MALIKRFEDLEIWQHARKLCNMIHILTQKDLFSKDYSLKDQIKRSSGSVMDNIAEGFERGGNKEFIQFLFISKSSSAEVRSQLYRALDSKYINESEFKEAYDLANLIASSISNFVNYLKKSDIKGRKFNYN